MAMNQQQIQTVPDPWADMNVNGIGRVYGGNGAVNWTGSGTLIRPQFVLTCAHNFAPGGLAPATAGHIVFGADPGLSVVETQRRTYPFSAACIPQAYVNGQPNWDVAVARLANPVNPNYVSALKVHPEGAMGWAGLGKSKVTLFGYAATQQGVTPGDAPTIAVGPLYMQSGTPMSYDASSNVATYQFDTRGGHSGGPVCLSNYEIVAVHFQWDIENAKQVGKSVLLTGAVQTWIQNAITALSAGPVPFVNVL